MNFFTIYLSYRKFVFCEEARPQPKIIMAPATFLAECARLAPFGFVRLRLIDSLAHFSLRLFKKIEWLFWGELRFFLKHTTCV